MKKLMIVLSLLSSISAHAVCQSEAEKAAIAVDEINSSYETKTVRRTYAIRVYADKNNTHYITYKVSLTDGEFNTIYDVSVSGDPKSALTCSVDKVVRK